MSGEPPDDDPADSLRDDLKPPKPPPVDVGEIAVAGLATVALSPVYEFSHELELVSSIASAFKREDPTPYVPPDVPGTAPPQLDRDGNALCTSCSVAVPYESMYLGAAGYFCHRCAHANS